MRHPFSGLSFTLHHNLLDFGVGWTNEKLGAVETDATQNFDSLHQESGMVDRLGEIYVSEVTGALGHAAGARLATRGALDNTLPGVHEAAELGPAPFHNLGELDAPVCHGHAANLFGAEDAELDALYRTHRRLRVPCVDGGHDDHGYDVEARLIITNADFHLYLKRIFLKPGKRFQLPPSLKKMNTDTIGSYTTYVPFFCHQSVLKTDFPRFRSLMKFLFKMATAKPLYRDCDRRVGNEVYFIPVTKLSGRKSQQLVGAEYRAA